MATTNLQTAQLHACTICKNEDGWPNSVSRKYIRQHRASQSLRCRLKTEEARILEVKLCAKVPFLCIEKRSESFSFSHDPDVYLRYSSTSIFKSTIPHSCRLTDSQRQETKDNPTNLLQSFTSHYCQFSSSRAPLCQVLGRSVMVSSSSCAIFRSFQ
jgi:hypothetical protein